MKTAIATATYERLELSRHITSSSSAHTVDALRDENAPVVATLMQSGAHDERTAAAFVALVAGDARIAVEFNERVHAIVLDLVYEFYALVYATEFDDDTTGVNNDASELDDERVMRRLYDVQRRALTTAAYASHVHLVRHLLYIEPPELPGEGLVYRMGQRAPFTTLLHAASVAASAPRTASVTLGDLLPPLIVRAYFSDVIALIVRSTHDTTLWAVPIESRIARNHRLLIESAVLVNLSQRAISLAYTQALGRITGADPDQIAKYGAPMLYFDNVNDSRNTIERVLFTAFSLFETLVFSATTPIRVITARSFVRAMNALQPATRDRYESNQLMVSPVSPAQLTPITVN